MWDKVSITIKVPFPLYLKLSAVAKEKGEAVDGEIVRHLKASFDELWCDDQYVFNELERLKKQQRDFLFGKIY